MAHDRRSFIRRFGVTLGSLILSGSLSGRGKKKEGGSSKTESQVKKTPRTPEWEQLRQCWLKLDTLDDDIRKAAKDPKDVSTAEEAVKKERTAGHRALLDTLMAKGELKEPVAEHIQTAFEEAVNYIDYIMPVRPDMRYTCYLPMPLKYGLGEDLPERADVLRKISADLDPATVAQALFEIFRKGPNDRGSRKIHDDTGPLEISPEALEAARLLARLFLETSG